MFRFEELEIWKLSVGYGKECYKLANKFPKVENYALADQLRRAGISVSNNIVEGSTGSAVNFKRYLNMAVGSTLETVNLVNFASEVGYIEALERADIYRKAETLIKKIRSFSNSLR